MLGSVSLSRTSPLAAAPGFRVTGAFLLQGLLIQVGQYLLNDHRIFDASDHFDCTAESTARLDVGPEYPLRELRPGQDRPVLSMAVLGSWAERTLDGMTVFVVHNGHWPDGVSKAW
jgi:hypothetical protein